jgi:hypothetical protein
MQGVGAHRIVEPRPPGSELHGGMKKGNSVMTDSLGYGDNGGLPIGKAVSRKPKKPNSRFAGYRGLTRRTLFQT